MKETEDWFAVWFDTKEYHTLYGHRDAKEAEDFVKKLIEKFNLNPCKVLDAGCGSGRHVHCWSQNGFESTGFDLSPNSIKLATAKAIEMKLENFKFEIHDLREIYKIKKWEGRFRIVTNLFTSFGYFSEEIDHKNVVKGFSHALGEEGLLVLDYINTSYSLKRLVPFEVQTKEDIQFTINRELKDGFFKKTISYNLSDNQLQTHTELVKAWSSEDLIQLLSSLGLHVKLIFGDYNLNSFHEDSPRMILIAEKK